MSNPNSCEFVFADCVLFLPRFFLLPIVTVCHRLPPSRPYCPSPLLSRWTNKPRCIPSARMADLPTCPGSPCLSPCAWPASPSSRFLMALLFSAVLRVTGLAATALAALALSSQISPCSFALRRCPVPSPFLLPFSFFLSPSPALVHLRNLHHFLASDSNLSLLSPPARPPHAVILSSCPALFRPIVTLRIDSIAQPTILVVALVAMHACNF